MASIACGSPAPEPTARNQEIDKSEQSASVAQAGVVFPGENNSGGSTCLQLCDQRLQGSFRIAEEHSRVVLVEQEILNTGEARGHRAFHDDDCFCAVGFNDRHAVNRTALVL